MYTPEPESEYERWKREQKERKQARKKAPRKANQRRWLSDLKHGHTDEGGDFENFERFTK